MVCRNGHFREPPYRDKHGQLFCKECRKRNVNNYKARNVSRVKQWSRAFKAPRKELVRRLREKPCVDCGKTYPYYVMDFDHRDPHVKTMVLSSMVANGRSLKSIEAEAAKCDVVCANCHRERTFGPKGNHSWVQGKR